MNNYIRVVVVFRVQLYYRLVLSECFLLLTQFEMSQFSVQSSSCGLMWTDVDWCGLMWTDVDWETLTNWMVQQCYVKRKTLLLTGDSFQHRCQTSATWSCSRVYSLSTTVCLFDFLWVDGHCDTVLMRQMHVPGEQNHTVEQCVGAEGAQNELGYCFIDFRLDHDA